MFAVKMESKEELEPFVMKLQLRTDEWIYKITL
jgi:hypothetical protein